MNPLRHHRLVLSASALVVLLFASGCGAPPSSDRAEARRDNLTLPQSCGPMPRTRPCSQWVCLAGAAEWVEDPYPLGTNCTGGGHCDGTGVCAPPISPAPAILSLTQPQLPGTSPFRVDVQLSCGGHANHYELYRIDNGTHYAYVGAGPCYGQVLHQDLGAPAGDHACYYAVTSNAANSAMSPVTCFDTALPAEVRILGSTAYWAQVLVTALGTPGMTVLLKGDVDMDLSAYPSGLHVASGVTLTSDAPRSPSNPGPRLFTNARPGGLLTLQDFGNQWSGDHVHIRGIRLQGPHNDVTDRDEDNEAGINIDSCIGVEIANTEIAGFAGRAIFVQDGHQRMSRLDDVWIHDNYIHNNQHTGENGYGVDVSLGAWANIERNLFDNNRHSITLSNGGPGGGFRADHNLQLRGGGVHGKFYESYTQVFDTHGDDNCWCPSSTCFNCGGSGDQFWITGNAFQYEQTRAIKLRGRPRISAFIDHNVFPKSAIGDELEVATWENVDLGLSNTTGYSTFGRYGVCDIDGDGADDLFLATGESWWFSSAGKHPWSFLSTNRERLEDIALGDFDGDGRCDVFAPHPLWQISSGATGPWTTLPGNNQIPIGELAFGDFNGDTRKDMFYRADSGQWWVISPGIYDWTPLESSGVPLGGLKFADFDGNGKTDVMAVVNGAWSVSWDGRSPWQRLNSALTSDAGALQIGNFDGVAGDDIMWFVPAPPPPNLGQPITSYSGTWYLSSGGQQPAIGFAQQTFPIADQTVRPHFFVGNFDGTAGSDLLTIDAETRIPTLLSGGTHAVAAWGNRPH